MGILIEQSIKKKNLSKRYFTNLTFESSKHYFYASLSVVSFLPMADPTISTRYHPIGTGNRPPRLQIIRFNPQRN
ncbi:MAG TPA: hypothetical protein PLA12_13925 [Candidatus Hydrogenedens sp.]|nr:hypothetical protein [Candidatus Hydrogenedens sp.]